MARYSKDYRGYYRTGVVIGTNEQGKPRRKWLSARTIGELERKISDVKVALGSGKNLIVEDVRFGEYARIWFETYKASRGINTRAMYQNLLKLHFDKINELRVKDIRPMNLQAVINSKADMPRICSQMRMCLRQIFKQAIVDDIISKNPADSLELPREVKKERRALTEEEKDAIKRADFTDRERALVMIAYGCGLRPGEIYALTWSDIDFKNGIIHVSKSLVFDNGRPTVQLPKTNKSIRDVEAPRIVLDALHAFRGANISPRLFCAKDGGYKFRKSYETEWKNIKLKIEAVLGHPTDLTLYYFRHNYCTALYYSGVSLKEAQRLLGHSSYDMIMKVYAHLDAAKEDTRAKLNAINF